MILWSLSLIRDQNADSRDRMPAAATRRPLPRKRGGRRAARCQGSAGMV